MNKHFFKCKNLFIEFGNLSFWCFHHHTESNFHWNSLFIAKLKCVSMKIGITQTADIVKIIGCPLLSAICMASC